ncbi:MAG: hydrogenase maturation nickel metallochaperone HypA [Bullifex sp.]
MHELGVVFHCLDQVRRIAEENNVKRVNSVTVMLGEVSSVIPYLFEDCWNWAVKKEAVLKDATLKIEVIKAVTYCENCNKEYPTVEYGKTCPHCGSGRTYLLEGNEIMIKEMEVKDE